MNPVISVVMPVYNVEHYVAESIRSVLSQTFTDFELIIVDDGATDRSLEICRTFEDPRIRILRQVNRGLPGARNTGIRHARGEFVAIIDSDDLWRQDKLALHIAHLRARPSVGISYSASEFIDGEGHSMGLHQRPKLTDITAADIFCRNPVGNGSVPVFRRSVFEEIGFAVFKDGTIEIHYFDETFRYCEDVECWARIALKTCWRFEGLPQSLTLYRVVAGGLSGNVGKMYEYWCKARDKIATYDPLFIAQWGRRAEGYQLRYYARRSIKEGKGTAAIHYLTKALRHYPRMLIEEPVRSAVTILAAAAFSAMPAVWINASMGVWSRPRSAPLRSPTASA